MKKITYCVIITLLFSIIAIPVAASIHSTDGDTWSLPAIISGGTLNINGTENELYPVFSNQHNALQEIKEEVPELLNTLSETYNLAPLTDSNWELYRDAMFMLLDLPSRPSDYGESNPDFIKLCSFFDIYENADKNADIKDYVNSSFQARSSDLEELALMLPSSTPITQEYMRSKAQDARGSTIPFQDAIIYASNYATRRNTPTYHSFLRGDCANFDSDSPCIGIAFQLDSGPNYTGNTQSNYQILVTYRTRIIDYTGSLVYYYTYANPANVDFSYDLWG